MKVTIRPVTEKDDALIVMFAASERDDQFKYFAASNPTLTFAAIDDENTQVLGFITSWQNQFHPQTQQVRTILNPEPIPTAIVLDALLNHERTALRNMNIDRPLVTMFWEPQQRKLTYYKQHGFEVVRNTWLPDLQLDRIAPVAVAQLSEIVPMRVLWDDPAKRDLALSLLRLHYELSHTNNPPRHLELNEWLDMLSDQQAFLDWSLAKVSGSSVLALSFVFPSSPSTLDIGWLTDINNDAANIIPLLQVQFQLLKQTEITSVFGELDSTDPVAMAVKNAFPWESAPAWLTLLEK